MSNRLRQIPSVDRLLGEPALQERVAFYGHRLVVTAVRETLAAVRKEVRAGAEVPPREALAARAVAHLENRLAPLFRPVINATGVIIHTNLGRSPLSAAARTAVEAAARGYSNLEYDLPEGRRGHRTDHVERILCELTGAEAALVVNNNAGAVLLALAGLAQGRGVLISRGQLVEIGGGFRIPDVMARSGARLIEVGTTNRTHRADYERVLQQEPDVALILRAHHSNFRIVGFTAEVGIAELVDLGTTYGVPVMDDLGSGALLDTSAFGLAHEPTVQESVEAGAAVVCFSGDKLLGGPQAGIIVGKAEFVDPLKRHPLARALRIDKLCLAALQATLFHYLRGEATQEIPIWRMIAAPVAEIDRRAKRWRRWLRRAGIEATVVDGRSTVGGGSLPGETLPTRLLALPVSDPDGVATALRAANPPVVARIEDDQLLLDPRTVLPEEEKALLRALQEAIT
ncbi:MAG TPA: L-seryl-tRNA(Sec) selenium transferase [Thermoflexia bacterium]|jgi:L-seryl-tRNA(Ser) seleniumtransferase|nr:L-seryl-tRNA(Sec) selenium transferase [Thermoflexia bacterium]